MSQNNNPLYYIVQLIDYTSIIEKDLVVIPSVWLLIDENQTQHFTNYIEPSENEDDKRMMVDFVSKRVYPVPQDWPLYSCVVKNSASTLSY